MIMIISPNAAGTHVASLNFTENLFDAVTGEAILSGYSRYDVQGDLSTGLYVYAKSDDSCDVYLLK